MSLGYPPRRRASLPLWPIAIAVGVVIVLVSGWLLWGRLPVLVQVSPADGSPAGARTPLELTFNQPMDISSFEENVVITPPVTGIWQADGNLVRFIPLENWPRNQPITIEVRLGARSALGLPLLQGRRWTFSAPSARVAYLRTDRAGVTGIWAVLPEGNEATRLTPENIQVYEFDVLPDGSGLIFVAARDDGGADLYTLTLADNTVTRLRDCAPDSCRVPVISPAGLAVAYERRVYDITRADFERQGLGVLDLTTNQPLALSTPPGTLHSPAWVTEGQLAFVDEDKRQIGVYTLGEGSIETLPNNANEMGSWYPVGPTLIYTQIASPEGPLSIRAPTPVGGLDVTPELTPTPTVRATAAPNDFLSASLFRVNLGSDDTTRLTADSDVEDTNPVISPNGQWLVFARKSLSYETWTPGRQLWVMRVDGSEARQLTNEPLLTHSNFVWSPDSFTVVLVRFNVADINQPPELWAIDRDGRNLHLLAIGGFLPRWLP